MLQAPQGLMLAKKINQLFSMNIAVDYGSKCGTKERSGGRAMDFLEQSNSEIQVMLRLPRCLLGCLLLLPWNERETRRTLSENQLKFSPNY